MDFKTGDVIKLYGWHAVVVDVFKSDDSGATALQLAFAKDLVRNNPLELHIVSDDAVVSQATMSDFAAEVAAMRQGQDERMKELETLAG